MVDGLKAMKNPKCAEEGHSYSELYSTVRWSERHESQWFEISHSEAFWRQTHLKLGTMVEGMTELGQAAWYYG